MRRVRQHVNPLKSDLLGIAEVPRVEAAPGSWLEVELGSAEAHFLMDRARAEPGGTFVGVDIRAEVVRRANLGAAKAGLHQVRSVFANISVDLPRLFADGAVRRLFLLFPDPWFKRTQHKRRVVDEALVAELERCLAAGGELLVQTDIFELGLDTMAAVEGRAAGRLANLAGPWSFAPANPFAARSRRERQCETEGVRIWRLHYRKFTSAGEAGT